MASEALARSQQKKADQLTNGRTENNNDEENERTDAMAALERQARAPMGFVAASTGPEGGQASGSKEQVSVEPTNPDAINLDDMDD